MSFVIRIMKKSEIKDIFRLIKEFYEELNNMWGNHELGVLGQWRKQSTLNDYVKWFSKKTAITFLLLSNNKPVGYIYGYIAYRTDMIIDKEGYINDFYIQPKYRGRGYGKKLLNEMLAWFKSKKLSYAQLDVPKPNKSARRLYKTLGFTDYMYDMRMKL